MIKKVKVLARRMVALGLVVMIAVLTAGLVHGETKILLRPYPDFSKLFPDHESFQGETIQFGGKVSAIVNNTVKIDRTNGDIDVSITSKKFEYRGSFDNSFNLRKSVYLFKDQDLIKLVGHDKRVTSAEQSQKSISIEYYLNNRQKNVKKITCDQNTVDTDILLFYLHGRLLDGNDRFNTSLITKSSGMKVNAGFRLITTSDLQKLSPEYNFPPIMKKIIDQKVDRYVYIMELNGIEKVFYPYRYYYVYDKEAPHNLIAYWGGSVKLAEYAYIIE